MNEMNTINHNNYAEWVERFLDAGTTVAEERELYAYFSRPDLPEGALRYRKMFGWYEALPAQDATAPAQSAASAHANRALRILPLRPWQWAGVAAVVALLFTLGLSLRDHTGTHDDDDYIYASYIIRNGHKITDPEVVDAELGRIEDRINRQFAAMDSRLESYDRHDVMLDTDNPEIRNFIETSLKF